MNQRKIKFRIWDKTTQKWVIKPETLLVDTLNDPDLWVMQYSGFEDRDQKEIYEGDILEVKNFESGITSKVTCKYSYGAFKFNGWLFPDLPEHGYFVKVLGNICENMDLLQA